MTTTAYDSVTKMVASDTRWSAEIVIDDQTLFVFTDDSEFTKIADLENASMVLAGNGLLIAEWKKWWYTSLDENSMPDVLINGINSISILIIDKKNNKIIFDAGQFSINLCVESQRILSVFSGSGKNIAASCWDQNRCPVTAIITASKGDRHTGEKVIWVDFVKQCSNITKHVYDISEIVRAITENGYIMDKATQMIITPIQSHPLGEKVTQAFASGEAVASAPVPGLSSFVWTDERMTKLKEAIKTVKRLHE